MHHLHFRYVSEQPGGQTFAGLFQLLDDFPPRFRYPLLRDVFTSFSVYGGDTMPHDLAFMVQCLAAQQFDDRPPPQIVRRQGAFRPVELLKTGFVPFKPRLLWQFSQAGVPFVHLAKQE